MMDIAEPTPIGVLCHNLYIIAYVWSWSNKYPQPVKKNSTGERKQVVYSTAKMDTQSELKIKV